MSTARAIVIGVALVVAALLPFHSYNIATSSTMPSLSNTFILEFNVRGAVVDAVNGDYRLESFTEEGEEEGDVAICHRYVKAGKWQGNDCEFCLHSVLQTSGETCWFISILQENDDETVHFYSSKTTPWCDACLWTDSDFDSVELQVTAKAMVTVPYELGPLKGQLFSEKCSDVKFVCQDGETIHAHKFVLLASPYFDAAFSGRWSDIDELETSHASSAIKTLLTLLYTGNAYDAFDRIKEAEDPVAFLRVATEYQIDCLKNLTEMVLIDSLAVTMSKDLWQTACRYDCYALKSAYVDFAFLMDDFEIMDVVEVLQDEDPYSSMHLCHAALTKMLANALTNANEHDDQE